MDRGYLLTFDFRKNIKNSPSLEETKGGLFKNKWVEWNGKRIFDVVLRVGNSG